MKLIVEVDADDYEALNKVGHNGLEFNDTLEGRVYRAIADGKPIVGYHGRLVDEDMVLSALIHGGHLDHAKCGEVTKIFDSAVVVDADMEMADETNN